ncbi:MAG: methyltransferase [Desulfomonile tiedjei]|uniref:Methyltransferase n=1 Tax=Desulfomonile tiedjei TaxID=2358 RepID=A0A9D6Z4N5_9BACT|nr:methyltransferase [Desulfomonile tiedjei]
METRKTNESVDGLLRNKIRVVQAKKGYRVSEDAIILTWFTRPDPDEWVLDAGCGCGVISFGLASREPSIRVIGLEIQGAPANRAARGIKLNGLESRVFIVHGDFRQANHFFRKESFGSVVSNPPYYESGRGKINLQEEKALSRHQMMMPPEDLFRVSGALLKSGGGLTFIYPASRLDRIRKAMKETGFRPARVLWIHSHEEAEPGLVCIEAKRDTHQDAKLFQTRLVLYSSPGVRTPAAEAILAGENAPELCERSEVSLVTMSSIAP